MSLPYLTEQEREAEWIDVQSLQESSEIGEVLAAALQAEATKFVASDKDRSMRQFTIGALLDEGETEANNKEKFWEEASSLLRKVSKGWSAFSVNTLRRWVRTIRRIDRLVDVDKYRAYLAFEYFAVAGEMVNDKDNRYVCKSVAEPLDWAVQRVIDGNAASTSAMQSHFLKDEHKPDPWRRFVGGFSVWAEELDDLPDNTKARLAPHVKELRDEIEKLERGEK